MIAKLFKERSKRFNTRCAKYSRYVLMIIYLGSSLSARLCLSSV